MVRWKYKLRRYRSGRTALEVLPNSMKTTQVQRTFKLIIIGNAAKLRHRRIPIDDNINDKREIKWWRRALPAEHHKEDKLHKCFQPDPKCIKHQHIPSRGRVVCTATKEETWGEWKPRWGTDRFIDNCHFFYHSPLWLMYVRKLLNVWIWIVNTE